MAAIQALKDAMARARSRMRELERPFSFPANCCPSCACGPEWNRLAAKLVRQAAWLRVLLNRQRTAAADAEVRSLELDYGPRELDAVHALPRKKLRALADVLPTYIP